MEICYPCENCDVAVTFKASDAKCSGLRVDRELLLPPLQRCTR
jgi:hypothetical protein